jgi:hypothetical protein
MKSFLTTLPPTIQNMIGVCLVILGVIIISILVSIFGPIGWIASIMLIIVAIRFIVAILKNEKGVFVTGVSIGEDENKNNEKD